MARFGFLKPIARSEEVFHARDELGHPLKVAFTYQDAVTRQWGLEMYRQVAQLFGADHIHDTWWNSTSLLSDPKLLQDAVLAATLADVMVVAVHAAEELPLDLYVWIDAWLPRRLQRRGVFLALIGARDQLDTGLCHALDYLQAVARKGNLDYVPHQCTLLVEDDPATCSAAAYSLASVEC
jgi:hypothetical protein